MEAACHIRSLYPESARPGKGRPPIVALTANAFAEDRASYLAAGLDDYFAKLFEKEDLWRRSSTAGGGVSPGAAEDAAGVA